MKTHAPRTAALIATFALPAFAQEPAPQPPAHQAPAVEHVELHGEVRIEMLDDGQHIIQAEEIELGDGDARVLVIGDGGGRIIVHFNDEAGGLVIPNGLEDEKLLFELARPEDPFLDNPLPAAPLVEAAYLGVSAEPLDFDSAMLLGVKRGTGLTVGFVAEDSPAAAAELKPGDVLTRLDDQLLVNPEQLAVLIRTHNPGDAVTLHLLREGEPIELKAELVARELPELGPGGMDLAREWRVQQNNPFDEMIPMGPLRGQIIGPDAPNAQRLDEMLREIGPGLDQLDQDPRAMIEQLRGQMQQHRREMDHVIEQMRQQLDLDLDGLRGELVPMPMPPGPPHADARMRASMMTSDGEHKIALAINGDERLLTVAEADGAVLFDGPMPDDGRIDGLPAAVQEKSIVCWKATGSICACSPCPTSPKSKKNATKQSRPPDPSAGSNELSITGGWCFFHALQQIGDARASHQC